MKTILTIAALALVPASSNLGATYASMSTSEFEAIDKMCEADLRASLAADDADMRSVLVDTLRELNAPASVRTIIMRQCASFARGARFGASL